MSYRPLQSGFTTDRSTVDATCALCLLSELHRKFRQPLRVAYVDIKPTFNSVVRLALWKTLRASGTPPFLCSANRRPPPEHYVRSPCRLTQSFATAFGVRQGCVLAPALFYYAALLPRRGPHIASHSVCPSVCLSVCLSVRPVIVTERHVAPPSELQ